MHWGFYWLYCNLAFVSTKDFGQTNVDALQCGDE